MNCNDFVVLSRKEYEKLCSKNQDKSSTLASEDLQKKYISSLEENIELKDTLLDLVEKSKESLIQNKLYRDMAMSLADYIKARDSGEEQVPDIDLEKCLRRMGFGIEVKIHPL
tara:strand:+ start:77 stop:415 length:339 start_codon:yes stop_codon:yes gene_type:complete